MTGTLGLFSLADLFQLLSASGRTGRLVVQHPLGGARVYFDKGQVRHAEFGALEGVAAVSALFGDERGTFSFMANLPTPRVTVEVSTESLLLDALRQLDEQRRDDPDDRPTVSRDAVPYAAEGVDNDGLPLAELERRVVASVNGHWTVSRMAEELGVELREVQSAVARLVHVGSLRLRTRRPRTARLVVRLSGPGVPEGSVGVDEHIVRAWREVMGEAFGHVALRREDGRAFSAPMVAVAGVGPYLQVPRGTLLLFDLDVEESLLARPHVQESVDRS